MWHSIQAACPSRLLNLDSFLALLCFSFQWHFEDYRTGICRRLQLALPDVCLPCESGPALSVECRPRPAYRALLPCTPCRPDLWAPLRLLSDVLGVQLAVLFPASSGAFSGHQRCTLSPFKNRRIRVPMHGVFVSGQFQTFPNYHHHFYCIHFQLQLCCLISKWLGTFLVICWSWLLS